MFNENSFINLSTRGEAYIDDKGRVHYLHDPLSPYTAPYTAFSLVKRMPFYFDFYEKPKHTRKVIEINREWLSFTPIESTFLNKLVSKHEFDPLSEIRTHRTNCIHNSLLYSVDQTSKTTLNVHCSCKDRGGVIKKKNCPHSTTVEYSTQIDDLYVHDDRLHVKTSNSFYIEDKEFRMKHQLASALPNTVNGEYVLCDDYKNISIVGSSVAYESGRKRRCDGFLRAYPSFHPRTAILCERRGVVTLDLRSEERYSVFRGKKTDFTDACALSTHLVCMLQKDSVAVFDVRMGGRTVTEFEHYLYGKSLMRKSENGVSLFNRYGTLLHCELGYQEGLLSFKYKCMAEQYGETITDYSRGREGELVALATNEVVCRIRGVERRITIRKTGADKHVCTLDKAVLNLLPATKCRNIKSSVVTYKEVNRENAHVRAWNRFYDDVKQRVKVTEEGRKGNEQKE